MMKQPMTMMKCALLLLLMLCLAEVASAQWQRIEGVYGGQISTLQKTDTFIFAGMFGEGLYRSSDGGASWLSVTLPQGHTSVLVMASDGSTLYAGLNERYYRTLDNGFSWEPISTRGNPGSAYKPLIVQNHRLFMGSGPGSIERSDDSGTTWHHASDGLPATFDVSMFAHDGGVLMAAGDPSGKIYRSLDGGAWSDVSPDHSASSWLSGVFSAPGLFMASYRDSLFRSTNGGTSWSYASIFPSGTISSMSGEVSDLHASTYDGIVSSLDSGTHWYAINLNVPNDWYVNAQAPTLLESEGKLLVAGQLVGLLSSSDGGRTLQRSDKGMQGETLYDLTTVGDVIIGGGQHGTYRSTDGGLTWNAHDGVPGGSVIGLYTAASSAIATTGFYTYPSIVFRSTDAGLSWDTLELPATTSTPVTGLFGTTNYLYVQTKEWELLRMLEAGNEWENITPAISAISGDSIDQSWSTRRMIFVAVGNGSIYRSRNDGATWENVSAGLPPGNQKSTNYRIATDEADRVFMITPENLYRLDPSGSSWITLPTGPYLSISGISGEFVAHAGTLFASLEYAGIAYLPSGASEWKLLNDGLYSPVSETRPYVMHLNGTSDALFASTSFGLWRRTFASLGINDQAVEENRNSERMSAVAPNPFTGTTDIHYTLSSAEDVTLKVFNALGDEVALLVDERREAGTWHAAFSGAGLPSGVYHYRLQVGKRVESGTIRLIR